MSPTGIEGIFARNSMPTSLLAALFWIRRGEPLTPFLTTNDPGPEQRFDGGAQQLSLRMADAVILSAPVTGVTHRADDVRATAGEQLICARLAP
jgi:hypothetical protein